MAKENNSDYAMISTNPLGDFSEMVEVVAKVETDKMVREIKDMFPSFVDP